MARIPDLIERQAHGRPARAEPRPGEQSRHDLRQPGMLRELKEFLEGRGFMEGNTSIPGDFVIKRALAEK